MQCQLILSPENSVCFKQIRKQIFLLLLFQRTRCPKKIRLCANAIIELDKLTMGMNLINCLWSSMRLSDIARVNIGARLRLCRIISRGNVNNERNRILMNIEVWKDKKNRAIRFVWWLIISLLFAFETSLIEKSVALSQATFHSRKANHAMEKLVDKKFCYRRTSHEKFRVIDAWYTYLGDLCLYFVGKQTIRDLLVKVSLEVTSSETL